MLRGSGERLYDVGSIALAPHMVLSSYKHFREAGPEGSIPVRTYADFSGEWEGKRGDAPRPNSQQAKSSHRLEDSRHIVGTHSYEVYR